MARPRLCSGATRSATGRSRRRARRPRRGAAGSSSGTPASGVFLWRRRPRRTAAAYAAGLIGNHPFIDGNKRIGFMAAYVFLARNGVWLDAPEAEAAHTVRNLAAGELNEDRFAAWLRDRAR